MTPQEVIPMRNKVDAVLKMGRPWDQTTTRLFIGVVTFNKTMCSRRLHVLAPLHKLTGVGASVWEPRHEQAFQNMKVMVPADAMSYYPDLNKPFKIYTNASEYQMGATIIQDGNLNFLLVEETN